MNTTKEIIEDLRLGKMVIIMDDEDRENEGDLIMAADYVRPEDINFMARFGRGLVCLTITGERCQQLRLPLMVNQNNAAFSTNFTVSIEAAEGVTTGISASDRAKTILSAVAKGAKPDDIVQPGHIFPIRARDGGVLSRAGHTEAGCDLARLAGAEPAAVIVEILNDDGSMARRPELEIFAKEHELKIGTIADLIHYRTENETTLERISECALPTEYGEFRLFAYQDRHDCNVHLAIVMGNVSDDEPVLVRVHARNIMDDVFSSTRSDCQMPIRAAMKLIAAAGRGVLVLIRQEENNKALAELIHQYQLQDNGVINPAVAEKSDAWRTTGTGSQILADLGVHKIQVLGAQKTYFGLSGFNLELVDVASM